MSTPEETRATLDAKDAEIARLTAERDALRKNAERYLALRDDFSPMGVHIDGQNVWVYRRMGNLRGPTLDDAIDAAMRTPPVFDAALKGKS